MYGSYNFAPSRFTIADRNKKEKQIEYKKENVMSRRMIFSIYKYTNDIINLSRHFIHVLCPRNHYFQFIS